METDFLFIVNYECPRCHASLEARATGSPHWLRCPRCGRASLPPEYDRIPPPPEYDEKQALLIGTFTTVGDPLPIRPRSMAPLPPAFHQKTPTIRLVLGVIFFITTILFFFSLLESSMFVSTFSAIGAALSLFLLTRPIGRDSGD